MIETGYKPEGALGGVFAGFNAANAEQGAELELIKQFLANQREQSMQPLDVNIRQTESDRATVGRSPEMLDAYQRGYIGQNNSQDAAGRVAMGTAQGNIDYTNAANANKSKQEQFLARLNQLKEASVAGAGQGQPNIGFQMQSPQGSIPVQGENFFSNFAKGSPQGNLRAINTIKDPVERKNALAAFKAYQEQVPSQAQEVNTNNSPLVPQPPVRNGGITQGGPEYEAVMQALVDQPELRQKLLIGDQKLDSSEYNQILKLMAAKEAAASHGSKDKNPWLEFSKLAPEKRLGTAYSAITTGTNPWTMQPLNDTERGIFEMYIAQDRPVQRQKTDPKTGAVDITGVTKGEVPTNAAPTLMPEGAKPAAATQPVGATKTIGGITYEKTEKGWIKK